MAEVSGRQLTVMASLAFLGGVIVGWKLKSLRVKYLQAKRNYLAKKSVETQRQIDMETGKSNRVVVL